MSPARSHSSAFHPARQKPNLLAGRDAAVLIPMTNVNLVAASAGELIRSVQAGLGQHLHNDRPVRHSLPSSVLPASNVKLLVLAAAAIPTNKPPASMAPATLPGMTNG
jgi:hypothetical protein